MPTTIALESIAALGLFYATLVKSPSLEFGRLKPSNYFTPIKEVNMLNSVRGKNKRAKDSGKGL